METAEPEQIPGRDALILSGAGAVAAAAAPQRVRIAGIPTSDDLTLGQSLP